MQPFQTAGQKTQVDEIAEEIAMLEARLHSVGLDGDCAYERALSKVYDALLVQRRRQLASLLTSA